MLVLNHKEDRKIELGEEFVGEMLDNLRLLLLSVEKEGSKNVESEVQIIKNMFYIFECISFLGKNSISKEIIRYKDC